MAQITISLIYADKHAQYHEQYHVANGTTLYQAIKQSGWLDGIPSLAQFDLWCQQNMDNDPNHKAWYVGIYSQKQRLDAILSDGDRVEIYRALSYDPMTRRQSRSKIRLKKLGHRPQ